MGARVDADSLHRWEGIWKKKDIKMSQREVEVGPRVMRGATEVINSFYGRETVPLNDAVIVGHGTTVSRKFIHANSDTSRRNTRVG